MLTRGVAAGLASLLLIAGGAVAGDPNEAGKAAYQRGDYATAERLFSQAIAGAPNEPLYHYHRAVALTQLGRWSDAVREYETVLRLNPDPQIAGASRSALQTLAPARGAPRRSRGGTDEVEIPLTRAGGGWVTDVVVNDAGRARFLVDTGASISMVSRRLADRLGIHAADTSPRIMLHTVAGQVVAPIVTISSLRVGDVEAVNVRAVIHEVGLGLEGILGNTFLDRYQITVDAARSTLIVRPR